MGRRPEAGERARQQAREQARRAGRGALGLGAILLSMLLAPLPLRWRDGIEERLGLDCGRVAIPSAVMQLLTFLALGIAGYFPWMHGWMDPLKGPLDNERDIYVYVGLQNPLMPVYYCFTTFTGFVGMVGAFGAAIRLCYATAMRENVADPVLALVDRAILGWGVRRARESREREKGVRTRDRVEHGGPADPWDLRIVTADDLDWPQGSTIRAFGGLHALAAIKEQHDPQGRLRNVYELKLLEGAAVVRGLREYRPSSPPFVVGAPEAPAEGAERAEDEGGPPRSIPLSPEEPRPR